MMRIAADTFHFLAELKENNNKAWFEKNKKRYLAARGNFTEFIAVMMERISKIEKIPVQDPAKCLYRIYRDVRFSPNKDPYKSHMAALVQRGLQPRKCAWYVHIQPGESITGGGMYDPRPEELKAIRQEIHYHGESLQKIISSKKFKELFGEIWSEDKLKKAPQGYSTDHPYIELLKYKHYLIAKDFTDEEVMSEDFLDLAVMTYKASQEFFEFIDTGLSLI
jgi:uncharacterized protein (TIGR02453 family)